jgi:putative ABC transport system permease protein
VLGASRSRLIWLLLSEAFVLGAAACTLGLALAWALIRALAALAPPEVPRMDSVAMSLPVLLFGILLALATVFVFGLGPAIIASQRDASQTLKDSGHAVSSTRAQGRVRMSLVVAEVALSLVLLVGAGLLVRSFLSLSAIDPGFHPERILTFRITTGLGGQQERRALYGTILERVAALPGVESAAAVLLRPLSGLVGWDGIYRITTQTPEEQRSNPNINYQAISSGYFRTMGIRMLSGRDFNSADTESAPGVVILNESTAKRHWPHESSIGKQLQLGLNANAPVLTVVAVVRDVRYREWEAVRPDFYVPYTQRAQHRTDFVVKTAGSPGSMAETIRNTVFSIDKNQPVSQLTTMERLVDRALSRSRFIATVLLALAAAALLLATLGIYGVLAYTVAERRFELGIRLAIGATPGVILRQLVSGGLRVAGAGAVAGLVLAFLASRLIAGLLYGVTPFDVTAYTVALSATLSLAAFACAVPAWRASRMNLTKVLRSQ